MRPAAEPQRHSDRNHKDYPNAATTMPLSKNLYGRVIRLIDVGQGAMKCRQTCLSLSRVVRLAPPSTSGARANKCWGMSRAELEKRILRLHKGAPPY
jgi:hypothetical protein